MTDYLGIIIHGFHNAVIDTNIKISEDSFFMASEHPSKISEGLESTMSGPPVCVHRTGRPKPSLQVFGSPTSSLIVPNIADHMKKLPPVEADDIIEPEGKTKKGGSRYVLYRY